MTTTISKIMARMPQRSSRRGKVSGRMRGPREGIGAGRRGAKGCCGIGGKEKQNPRPTKDARIRDDLGRPAAKRLTGKSYRNEREVADRLEDGSRLDRSGRLRGEIVWLNPQ